MKKFFTAILITAISACGGSGGGTSSAIEGIWQGDVIQGVIICTGGISIGAGAGTVIRQVSLDVAGSDEIGSPVQANFDDCFLEGVRDANGFRAEVVSGCDQGLAAIRFNLLGDGAAGVNFIYELDKVPEGDNGIRCIATPEAVVRR